VNGAVPGSLGMATAECDFSVELTDVSDGFVPPGYQQSGDKSMKFYYLTGTSIGQVRILNPPANVNLDARSAQSSSTQTLRSRILAGPLAPLKFN
jgi:hypothetical protein